ncbi:MAG: hypothetical protein KC933_14875 [Myxococcales bacterium]|nr:hypothetical protein [Myxococcales bacterium]
MGARFEQIATPAALLEGLSAEQETVRRREEARALEAGQSAARRKRGFVWLGVGFVGMFLVPALLKVIDIEAIGGVGALLVIGALGYGVYQLFEAGTGVRFEPPDDPARFALARAVLEALLPDLAPTEATLWVVTDPVARAPVAERRRREGGGWLEVRTLEWFQLEAQAGDGSRWTIGARIVRREKSKPSRRGTKTRVFREERVRVALAASAKQPLPEGTAVKLARLAEQKRAVSSSLRVARARATNRRAEVELVLDEGARSGRVEAARRAASFGFFAADAVFVTGPELVLGAALLGRLRG